MKKKTMYEENIQSRITKEQYQILSKYCKEKKISNSDFVRSAIEQKINEIQGEK